MNFYIKVAKEAYRALLIITLLRPTTLDYTDFERQVKNQSLADYGYNYGNFEVSVFQL